MNKFNFKNFSKTASQFRVLSDTNANDVTSLTSVFGMRTGVTRLLWPSQKSETRKVYKTFYTLKKSYF